MRRVRSDNGKYAPAVTENNGRAHYEPIPPQLVTTRERLEPIIGEIRSAQMVALDLETTGLNPRMEKVRLIDCFEGDPRPLFPVLAHKKLVMHNGAFDLGFLMKMGFELGERGEVVDTMLLSQLLDKQESVDQSH